MPFKSEKRLYLNSDRSKVVEEDDADAAYLLVNAGGQVSDADAKQYDLKKADVKADAEEKAEEKPAENKAEEKAESKQVEDPPENKARTMERGSKDK